MSLAAKVQNSKPEVDAELQGGGGISLLWDGKRLLLFEETEAPSTALLDSVDKPEFDTRRHGKGR